MDELKVRYEAAMVLSGVGDAMGYKNGIWEFGSLPQILKDYNKLGGYQNITIAVKDWRLSDDTIMHLATASAITKHGKQYDFEKICESLAEAYVDCIEQDMAGRGPGRQCISAASMLRPSIVSKKEPVKWNELPYSNSGGGCGGSMRSMCIGLMYYSEESLDRLIALSIESGRITHNHPVGFLGALVSALFTSYAIRDVPVVQWGGKLMDEVMPKALDYVKNTLSETRKWEDYERGWNYFVTQWEAYLKLRKIPFSKCVVAEGEKSPLFPEVYGFEERDIFYEKVSFSGWGGSSGHDSVMIAYDALLGAGDNWEEMINRSILHSGDNDSTGAIGCCWWGALYSYKGVPSCNYEKMELLRILRGGSLALFNNRS